MMKKQIHYLEPPNLTENNIYKKIICNRPLRNGGFHLYIENKKNQIIIHNYGHGGSGITLAPGSVEYIYDKLLQNYSINKKEKIVIIGAGIIGLYTAYKLLLNGFYNLEIMADSLNNTTSNNAGSIFGIIGMNNNISINKLITKLLPISYEFYKNIAKGNNHNIRNGVINTYTYYDEQFFLKNYQLYNDFYKTYNFEEIILDFHKGRAINAIAYKNGLFIDSNKIINHLLEFIKKHKISININKINDLNNISNRIIFNCTGSHSKYLNNDNNIVNLYGHILLLKHTKKNIPLYNIIYNINNPDYFIYYCPKNIFIDNQIYCGVIGGTLYRNLSYNENIFNKLLEINKKFYGINGIIT